MEIEHIEEWKGRNVVDPDGEKIGKLEDVLFEVGGSEPVFASVKTGLLGRGLSAVPLAGATFSRDQVRVAHSKDAVKGGPQMKSDGGLTEEDERSLAAHYGAPTDRGSGDGLRYESGSERSAREARRVEAEGRATELEQLAESKGGEADKSERQADEARQEARRIEEERDRARERADQARDEAGGDR